MPTYYIFGGMIFRDKHRTKLSSLQMASDTINLNHEKRTAMIVIAESLRRIEEVILKNFMGFLAL
jgi:hypothetical protein